MTGRDLIMYILSNGLENEPIFKNGRFIGFLTVNEAAVKFDVGVQTIRHWVEFGYLEGVKISNDLYIPSNAEVKERKRDEKQNISSFGGKSLCGFYDPRRYEPNNNTPKPETSGVTKPCKYEHDCDGRSTH